MTIGKREQRVIVGIAGLGLIGALHFFVFSGRNQQFQEAIVTFNTAKDTAGAVSKIRNIGVLTKMNEDSKKLDESYVEIVKGLELKKNPAFVVPTPDPKETDPSKHQKILDDKRAEQKEVVYAEIRKVMEFDPKRAAAAGATAKNGKTDMAFLGEGAGKGWRLPVQLPPNLGEGVLRDLLSDIDGTLRIIDGIDKGQTDLITRQRAYYEAQLLKLGVDNSLYKNTNVELSLQAQGEPVPLIHKVAHAMLLEKAVEKDPQWKGQIEKLLEINPPYAPIKSLGDSDMYFMYEQLVRLNATLEIMVKNEVSQVFGVVLEGPTYLEKQEQLGENDPKIQGAWKRPLAIPSPWVLNFSRDPALTGKNAPAQADTNPADMATDIGFVSPIILEFKATNAAGWKVIHQTLNSFPMAEVDQISMFGDKKPDSGEIYWQVRFSFVLQLFMVQTAS